MGDVCQTEVILRVRLDPGLAGLCPHVLVTSLLEVFTVTHCMGYVLKSRQCSSASGPGGCSAPQGAGCWGRRWEPQGRWCAPRTPVRPTAEALGLAGAGEGSLSCHL